MLVLITGEPGIGKSTLLLRLFDMLKVNYKVGGIIAKEIRKDNNRIGFEFIELNTDNKMLLASINSKGIKIGKYYLNLEGCKSASIALLNAINNYDIIICDELGPMELKSNEFRDTARTLLNSTKDKIVSIHMRLRDPLIEEYKMKAEHILIVTKDNRDILPYKIVELINK